MRKTPPEKNKICENLNDVQKNFVDFILERYINSGEEELDEKLDMLLKLKYNDVSQEVTNSLGGIPKIREIYLTLQKELYNSKVA